MRERATEIVKIGAPVLIEVVAVVLAFNLAIIWIALKAHGS